jgi:EAL domain-containing protein (putative c-di-GMP-specific phosphodiesterase class I)
MSVNVSPYQLADRALPAKIAAILQSTGMPAADLQLEITESAAVERHSDVLTEVAGLGVKIALDDFGTGFANLAALTRLPITCVKLDRQFIQEAFSGDDTTLALLRHLLGLFRRLKVTVVAEGIENEAQQYLLTVLGYQYGQGFHLGRPQPADALTF